MSAEKHSRPTFARVRKHLRELGTPKDAKFLQRFFKSGPGQYGAGDKFLGIRVPAIRGLAREFSGLPLDDVVALLHDEWHEARLLAVILLGNRYGKGSVAERQRIFTLYLSNATRVNNWDLVDLSAGCVVGAHLATRKRGLLDTLARSKNLWERRIAIVSTLYFIRHDELDDTLRMARILMHDDHDLVHKAVGWMLREVGKRGKTVLEGFLEDHGHELPRTALRYAIEHMNPANNRYFMGLKERRTSSGRWNPS
jgi:3-methyladenine DNA glycosylase AlkD